MRCRKCGGKLLKGGRMNGDIHYVCSRCRKLWIKEMPRVSKLVRVS